MAASPSIRRHSGPSEGPRVAHSLRGCRAWKRDRGLNARRSVCSALIGQLSNSFKSCMQSDEGRNTEPLSGHSAEPRRPDRRHRCAPYTRLNRTSDLTLGPAAIQTALLMIHMHSNLFKWRPAPFSMQRRLIGPHRGIFSDTIPLWGLVRITPPIITHQ